MSTNLIEHPDKEQLIAFGLGKLDPADFTEIEAHLGECETCCDTLLNLNEDTFVKLVRTSGVDEKFAHEAASINEIGSAPTVQFLQGRLEKAEQVPHELAEHSRYRVLKLIGKGGMGLVFKAEHRLMNRNVALKVVRHELISNDEAVQRFRREVQAAARLSHPNIVTAYDAEQAGDIHFLVMEYIDGENLSEVIKRDGPLAIDTACEYISQVAAGLEHASSKGMVHRDIKPHNLMVNSNARIKILDFGLATFVMSAYEEARISATDKVEAPYVTALCSVMGTPDFISPEQATDGRAADIRSDIYSLGCTFYYLLAGRSPFNVGTPVEKITAHVQSEPAAIETIRNDIPASLVTVIRRMMAKNPADRYQTPAETAEALAPFTSSQRGSGLLPNSNIQVQALGSRKPPRSRILIGAALAGILAVLGAVFVIEMQKTTVRFEVNDPNVSVSFGEDLIVVKDTDREFTIAPKTKQRFIVKQNGTELETDTFTLDKGQKVALKITVVEGKVQVKPNDESVAVSKVENLKKADETAQSVEAWVARLKSLRDHNTTAFVVGPSILVIDPDKALEAVEKAWPQITVPEVKTGILKVFAFSKPLSPKKHPRVLQVLDLGVREADPAIISYALGYVAMLTGEDSFRDRKAYIKWYEENGKKPLEEVGQVRTTKLISKIEAAMQNGEFDKITELAIQIGDTRSPVAIPTLIGIIDADNSYETVYKVGYFGLNKITGVDYSSFHDGAWWRRWWEKNKSRFSKEIRDRPVPDFPKTAHGKKHRPFPDGIDTLAGKLAFFTNHTSEIEPVLFGFATEVAAHKDPAAIPFLIGMIDADNTYDTVYGAGYYGLSPLTGVRYDQSHDGAWWRRWWEENKSKFSAEAQVTPIPDLKPQLAAWKKKKGVQQSDIADVPVQDLHAGDNKNMRYFLIGPQKEVAAPKSGYKVIVVMPGGDGGEKFNDFVRRIYKKSMKDSIVVEPVAFKWKPDQEIVWPTRTNKVEGQEFATEDFVAAILRDVGKKYAIDKSAIYSLSWSSSGPAAYALALAKDTPIAGSYVAMSVFIPETLPPLKGAKGHAFFIDHSPEDQICKFEMAEAAKVALEKEGATVKFNTYEGGHGWHGDVFGRIKTGMEWLQSQGTKK